MWQAWQTGKKSGGVILMTRYANYICMVYISILFIILYFTHVYNEEDENALVKFIIYIQIIMICIIPQAMNFYNWLN